MAEVQTLNQADTGLAAVVAAVADSLGIDLSDDNSIARVKPIFPTGIYDQQQAEQVTGLSTSTLFRAVDKGKLRVRRAGRKRLYLGSDLLDFVKGGK